MWPVSKPVNVAGLMAPQLTDDLDNKAPRTVAEIDDVHFDSVVS